MKSKNAFKRTICFLLILVSIALCNITPVYASQDLPSDIESNLDSFFYYMEIGDEQVYDYIDASHKIVNTTLFDIIGAKGVTKFVFSIFGIVVGILFLVGILFVIAIIVVIIVIVHNKNKKNNLNKI